MYPYFQEFETKNAALLPYKPSSGNYSNHIYDISPNNGECLIKIDCKGSHALKYFKTYGFQCNICKQHHFLTMDIHGCPICHWDICPVCYAGNYSYHVFRMSCLNHNLMIICYICNRRFLSGPLLFLLGIRLVRIFLF